MGHEAKAKCLDCGNEFEVSHGGGFAFHLLRCDKCGANRSVHFDDIYELHTRYLKGLSGPYSIASSEHDRHIQENVNVEPVSEEDYHTAVEKVAGACECGGHYRFDAPPRCPECKSTNIEEGEPGVWYD